MNTHKGEMPPKNHDQRRKTKQVKVTVDADLAYEFSKACAKIDISIVGAISKFMSDFANITTKKKPLPDYSTKRQRRAAIKKMVTELEQIMDGEITYLENIPENLTGSVFYDNAEQFISSVEDAIEILSSI
jgi:hypothetical protein